MLDVTYGNHPRMSVWPWLHRLALRLHAGLLRRRSKPEALHGMNDHLKRDIGLAP